MPDEIQLPDGVERYNVRGPHALIRKDMGQLIRLIDLPAIIAQEREKVKERLLSEQGVRRIRTAALAPLVYGKHETLLAALEELVDG